MGGAYYRVVSKHGSPFGLDQWCVGQAFMSLHIFVLYACGLCSFFIGMVAVMVVVMSPFGSQWCCCHM